MKCNVSRSSSLAYGKPQYHIPEHASKLTTFGKQVRTGEKNSLKCRENGNIRLPQTKKNTSMGLTATRKDIEASDKNPSRLTSDTLGVCCSVLFCLKKTYCHIVCALTYEGHTSVFRFFNFRTG